MKVFHLTALLLSSALSLASANAMPDLGRETGKFIRKDESVPKDVRTFRPTETTGSKKTDGGFAMHLWQPAGDSIQLAITMPTHPPTQLAITMPTHPPTQLAITMPTHPPTQLAITMPTHPPTQLAITMPTHPPTRSMRLA
ncbi:MAG: hypothetical protein JO170_31070 [Verrucomicrobia bacterium]|nr:hypothetical protein [Verrucomicrobiota bacterium]